MKILLLILCLHTYLFVGAHSDGDFIESDLFKTLAAGDKAVVLMVHFGTTYDDTRTQTIDAINEKVKDVFKGVDVCEAYTSRIVMRRLKARGIEKLNPTEALQKLHQEGYTHILVQSSNIIEGTEMKELRREIAGMAGDFKEIRVGDPLLSTPEDYEIVVKAVYEDMEKNCPEGARLLVGHGTSDPATASYAMLDYMLKSKALVNYHVGTVEGYPAWNDAFDMLKKTGVKDVTLAPLMFVAGDHAKNDIAGEWKENLEKEGYKVHLHLKGLGENPAVQELFIRHARFAAQHKRVDMTAKKKKYAVDKD